MMRSLGERVTGWRRVAGAMWHAPDDPQIFGALDIDAAALLAFIEPERARGHRITAVEHGRDLSGIKIADADRMRAVLPVTATIDHRYADGWHIGRAMGAFREYLAAPQRLERASVSRGYFRP